MAVVPSSYTYVATYQPMYLQKPLTYRVSLMYVLNNIDRVFDVSITSTLVKPNDTAQVRILFRPRIADQSYTDYYVVDDTAGNNYRLTVNGKCFGKQHNNCFYSIFKT